MKISWTATAPLTPFWCLIARQWQIDNGKSCLQHNAATASAEPNASCPGRIHKPKRPHADALINRAMPSSIRCDYADVNHNGSRIIRVKTSRKWVKRCELDYKNHGDRPIRNQFVIGQVKDTRTPNWVAGPGVLYGRHNQKPD